MTIVIDQDPQATAIKAALNTAMSSLNGAPKALDFDENPIGAAAYVRVDLSRRFVIERRFGGDVPVPGGRLTLRYVARNIYNARALRKACTAALEGQTLAVGSDDISFMFEVEDPIEQDDAGFWTGADTFTFA